MARLSLSVAAVALSLIAACVKPPAPPLRVGANVWPGYELIFLARDRGWLPEREVRLVEFPSASEVINAFDNGSLEAAMLTLDEALLLCERGQDVKVALVLDTSYGGDVILARPPIQLVADLAGRKVGVEGGALGAYVLSRALELNGVDPDSIHTVPLTINEHGTAYARGRVDALVTFEPVRSQVLEYGANEIFSSREIPGEIVDVLVIRADVAAERPAVVRRLADAHFRARDFLLHDAKAASRLIAQRMRLSPEAVLQSYLGLRLPSRAKNKALLAGAHPGLESVARRLMKTLVEKKLLQKELDLSDLFLDQGREEG